MMKAPSFRFDGQMMGRSSTQIKGKQGNDSVQYFTRHHPTGQLESAANPGREHSCAHDTANMQEHGAGV